MGIQGNIKRHILLVDDEPGFLKSVKPSLEKRGFIIDCPASSEEVIQKIKDKSHHFYIFDLHFEAFIHSDPTAGKFIRTMKEHLPKYLEDSWVVLTADDEQSDSFKFISDMSPQHIRKKDDLEKIIEWILECFNEFTPYNWLLEIEDTIENIEFSLSEGIKLSGIEALGEVEELIRFFFRREAYIAVSYLQEQGYSSSVLLSAAPRANSRKFKSLWYVIKIGKKELCKREKDNYINYVKSTDFKNKALLIDDASTIGSLGGLLFELKKESKPLKNLYIDARSDADFNKVKNLVLDMLDELDYTWYSEANLESSIIARRLFNDISMDELSRKFSSIFTEITDNNLHIIWQVGDYRVVLNNPLKYIPPKNDGVCDYVYCLVHGDLHLGNILVQKQWRKSIPILIDFASINPDNPLFRDFAKLEEHILIDLLTLEDSLSVEVANKLLDCASLVTKSESLNNYEIPRMDSRQFENTHKLISEIRKKLYKISTRILKGKVYEMNEKMEKILLRGYLYSLLKELINSWYWLESFSPTKKMLNLMVISKIIDRYCKAGSPSTTITK